MPHYRIVSTRFWVKNEISSLRLLSQVIIGDEKLVSLNVTYQDITPDEIAIKVVKVKNSKDLELDLKVKLGYDGLIKKDDGTKYDTIEGDSIPTEKSLLLRKILYMVFSDMLTHDDETVRENTESICKELAKAVKMESRDREKKLLIRLMNLEEKKYKDSDIGEKENEEDTSERQLFRALSCYTSVLSMCGYSKEELIITLDPELSDEMVVFYAAFKKYRDFVLNNEEEEESSQEDTNVEIDQKEKEDKTKKEDAVKEKERKELPSVNIAYEMHFSLSRVCENEIDKEPVLDLTDNESGALFLAISKFMGEKPIKQFIKRIDIVNRDGLSELRIIGNSSIEEQKFVENSIVDEFSTNAVKTDIGYLYVEERVI